LVNTPVLPTSALTTIKQYVFNFCNKVYQHNGVNHIWSATYSVEELERKKQN